MIVVKKSKQTLNMKEVKIITILTLLCKYRKAGKNLKNQFLKPKRLNYCNIVSKNCNISLTLFYSSL